MTQEDIRDLLATVLHSHGYRTHCWRSMAMMPSPFSAGMREEIRRGDLRPAHAPHRGQLSLWPTCCGKIRADIPILFMSGLNEGAGGREGVPATSKRPVLALKPFRPIALLEAIHRLLQPRRAPQT